MHVTLRQEREVFLQTKDIEFQHEKYAIVQV